MEPSAEGTDAAIRVAVIDIGTNSTRLLVAEVADRRVRELERETQVTRLGRGVDLSGQLSAEAIEATCDVVGGYVDAYERLGAERIAPIATSAVRDASNSGAFLAELRERFALDARILEGGEEARLTYLGATSERRGDAERTLVCDIGGGSTELIVGEGDEVSFHASIQAGVVRFSERHLASDPPAAGELEELAEDVRGLIAETLRDREAATADRGIAVAGTATSLAAIDLELDPYDRARVHGHRLPIASIQHMCSRLASVPLEERRGVTGLHPDRAPTIVAGVVILIQVMRALGLDDVEVSERDILHGAALEAGRSR